MKGFPALEREEFAMMEELLDAEEPCELGHDRRPRARAATPGSVLDASLTLLYDVYQGRVFSPKRSPLPWDGPGLHQRVS
jgi:hypothetical protein